MQRVIEEAVKALEKGEPCVLATVVGTSGSTPQKPGAKLLVKSDGSTVGTLGGGCVEGEIWSVAGELLRQGGGPQYQEYQLNDELAAQDGLVCGGTMRFFLEPIRKPEEFLPCAREILDAYHGGNPVAQATVVKAGHGRRNTGARLLIRHDGTASGTLESPSLETVAKEAARRLIDYGKSEYLVTEDGTALFIEGFTTTPTLVMMGGGHIGKALTSLARLVGFRTCVIDDRPQFASRERFPEADELIVGDFATSLSRVPVNANTFIVVATRGHQHDDAALAAALESPARYVGLVGSKRKTMLIYEGLRKRGFPVKRLEEVHAPVGLDIGAVTPEEIAVSVMAEIIMCRMGGDGKPLKLGGKYLKKAGEGTWATSPPSS